MELKQAVPNIIKIEQAKEPPKEILEQTFEMPPDLLKADETKVIVQDKSGIDKPVEKQVEKPIEKPAEKQVAEKKEEKKEEKKVSSFLKPPSNKEDDKKVEDKKETVKQIVLPSKDKRDLSSYSQEEQAVLRQMSNEAFEFTSKLIASQRELSKNKDNMFYQHPNAYLLSPQFQEHSSKLTLAQKEAGYWQSCLESLEEGKPIKQLEGWDEAGNPVFGAEIQPTKRVEELVRLNMTTCYGVIKEQQTALKNLPQTFGSRVKEDLKAIQDERSARFAWVADPKLLDYTLEVDGIGQVSLKQIKENIVNLFPAYLRSNPAVEVVGDLMIALKIQDAELKEARAGKNVAEIKQEELKRGEPKSSVKPGSEPKGIGGVTEFSLSGMPQ